MLEVIGEENEVEKRSELEERRKRWRQLIRPVSESQALSSLCEQEFAGDREQLLQDAEGDDVSAEEERESEERRNLPAQMPDPAGTGLEDCEVLPLIYNMLCSGWSVWQVVIVLARTEGIKLDPKAVQAYYERIPKEHLLPQTSLMKHFRGIKVVTDPMEEMEMVLRLCQERLSLLLEEEERSPHHALLRSRVNAEINQYWRKLREFAELQGKLNATSTYRRPESYASTGPKLGEILGLKITERTVEINPSNERVIEARRIPTEATTTPALPGEEV